jgi:rSAM/selenodomain-associated transferase 2
VRISIIVPVLNEAPILRDFLARIRALAPSGEIIVVDGGSKDESLALARDLADQSVPSSPGRATQMNTGAALARGDVLWFVHADSVIAPDSMRAIEEVLSSRNVVGGCFRLRIDSPRWVYRVRDGIGNLLVGLFGFALGDRGIFCRREFFAKIGGYPEVAFLEDAAFYRKLKKEGRVVQLKARIRTSARRYEELGPVLTMFFYALIMLLYVMRIPLPILERIVRSYMKKRVARAGTARRALPKLEGRPPPAGP